MTNEQNALKLPNINELASAIFMSTAKDVDNIWKELTKFFTPGAFENTQKNNAYLEDLIRRYSSGLTTDSPATQHFLNFLKTAMERNNPNINGMDAFKRNAYFLLSMKTQFASMQTVMVKSYMEQASQLITDEAIRYETFRELEFYATSQATKRELFIAMVQCKKSAQLVDWIKLVHAYDTLDNRLRVFQQTEQHFAEKVSAEMTKMPYDVNKIQKMTADMNQAIGLVRSTFEHQGRKDEGNKWASDMQEKYALEKILNGGPDYASTLPAASHIRITDLEAELKQIKTKEQNQSRIIDTLNTDIDRLKTEIAHKQQQILELEGRNTNLERNVAQSDEHLEKILGATGRLKSGLFNSASIKEVKDVAAIIRAKKANSH